MPTKRYAHLAKAPRAEREEAVRELLAHDRLTRAELVDTTGLPQQRISELIRAVGAFIVGVKHPEEVRAGSGNNKPAPQYSLTLSDKPQSVRQASALPRVNSVWALGGTTQGDDKGQ